jgi:hypothetical protein
MFWTAVWFAILATEGFFTGSDSPLALPGSHFWCFLLIAPPDPPAGLRLFYFGCYVPTHEDP